MRLSAATSFGSIAGEPPQKKRPNASLLPCSSSSLLPLLPEEITLNILARVPRRYYPWISLVSKTLNRLISSPEIYIERSVTHRTEHVLFVVLRSYANETPLWFTLNSKPFEIGNGNENRNSHRLVPIPSFPSIHSWGMSIIAIESDIYILGGCGVNNELVSTAFVFESGSNTCRYLPNMKEPRGCAAAGIIDGKLYMIGGCNPSSENYIEAFDLEMEIWETVTIDNKNVEMHEKSIRSFVMNDKIYIMDRKKSFVYDPKAGKLEEDDLVNLHWKLGSCVIDDRLYSFGPKEKEEIWVFDANSKVWSCVKGLEELPNRCSRMENRGGRLVVFYNVESFTKDFWCAEIELETRQGEEGGEIWGKILWSSLVFTSLYSYSIMRSFAVTM